MQKRFPPKFSQGTFGFGLEIEKMNAKSEAKVLTAKIDRRSMGDFMKIVLLCDSYIICISLQKGNFKN